MNDRDSDKPAAGDPAPEAQDGGPQAPPPATWAGRARRSQGRYPAPDEEHGEGPASLPDDTDADQLEEELDAEELDEEALAEELGEGNGPGPGHDTVEADTPTLADREAAREAALAGLRARTAEHAAKQTTGASGTAAPAAPTAPEAPAAPPEAPPAAEPEPPGEETPAAGRRETAPPRPRDDCSAGGRGDSSAGRGACPSSRARRARAPAPARPVAALCRRIAPDHRRDGDRDRGQHPGLPGRYRQGPGRSALGSERDRRRRPGQAADDPHPRLRQAPGGPGDRGALGHDDPAPRCRRSDHGAVDPARPEGEHPRPRDRQVQRRLLVRRAEADPEGRQTADGHRRREPCGQRRLQRICGRGQRDRLRLRRRRPPLLPLQCRAGGLRAVRRDRHPGRLPADVRLQRPPVRSLPPRRQRPGALGAPAGVPARGAPGVAGVEDPGRPQSADRHPEEVRHLRHRKRDRPGGSWKAVHRRPQRPGGPGPLPGQPRGPHRLVRDRLSDGDQSRGPEVRGRDPGRARHTAAAGKERLEVEQRRTGVARRSPRSHPRRHRSWTPPAWGNSTRPSWPGRRRRVGRRWSTSRSTTPPSWRWTRP